jgi:uncharacterized lipoprotein
MIRAAPLFVLVAAQVAALTLGGCSRNPTVQCEDPSRYASSRSVPPVQVPDDLTVPDETDALRVPDARAVELPPEPACLERPPQFGSQGAADEDA